MIPIYILVSYERMVEIEKDNLEKDIPTNKFLKELVEKESIKRKIPIDIIILHDKFLLNHCTTTLAKRNIY